MRPLHIFNHRYGRTSISEEWNGLVVSTLV
jgi:hypothetical protein